MEYLDFDLEIGPGSEGTYPVAVLRSPAGETRTTARLPFHEQTLEQVRSRLQVALLRSSGGRRQTLSPDEQAVQSFGQQLFDALFSGDVRSCYDFSRQQAVQREKGLRLRLRIQAPELATLPWEFLYDARQGEYPCLSGQTPIVRYLDLPQPVVPLRVEPPLRILGVIASPSDLDPLDVEHERSRFQQALAPLEAQGLVKLVWLRGQTWQELQRAMWAGPWHVFHFIGHGGFDATADEGVIALANEQGTTHLLRASELGRLLANHASLRLALLNACEGAHSSETDLFSSTAATLARRGIPAVLAMQYAISDHAAIEFTRVFYEALAAGIPVDAAVSEARTAISVGGRHTLEWGTPVLYSRAPDGVLFNVPKPSYSGQIQLPTSPPLPANPPSPAGSTPAGGGAGPAAAPSGVPPAPGFSAPGAIPAARKKSPTILIASILVAVIVLGALAVSGYVFLVNHKTGSTNSVLYLSTLTRDTGEWNCAHAVCAFQPDGYHVKFKEAGINETFLSTSRSFTNTVIEVTGIIVQGNPNDAGLSVAFRVPQTSLYAGYIFRVYVDGTYGLERTDSNGNYVSLISGETLSNVIHKGLNQPNDLKVVVNGSQFTLYVNGQQIDQASDSTYTSGYIALGEVTSQGETPTEAVFSDMTVTSV